MFKFSRAFERFVHSREQEARRQLQCSLPGSARRELMFSDGFDTQTGRSKDF